MEHASSQKSQSPSAAPAQPLFQPRPFGDWAQPETPAPIERSPIRNPDYAAMFAHTSMASAEARSTPRTLTPEHSTESSQSEEAAALDPFPLQQSPESPDPPPPVGLLQRRIAQPTAKHLATKHPSADRTQPSIASANLLDVLIRNAQTTAPVQAKLTIGQPNDPYEQEADATAAKVMAMPDLQRQTASHPEEEEDPVQAKSLDESIVQREAESEEGVQTKPLAASITPLVQREALPEEEEPVQAKAIASIQQDSLLEVDLQTKCETCEQEEKVQRSANGVVQTQPDLESRLNDSKGGGSPLPDKVRSHMEPRFGVDFSRVRVHTDASAIQMNKDLKAQAFTYGSDIYFGAGKSPDKNELTAHELTHVVQQTGAIHHKLVDTKDSTPHLSKKQSTSSNEESNEASSSSPVTTDTSTDVSSSAREENLPSKPELAVHSTSKATEQPSDRYQAQVEAQRNTEQIVQSGKPEFSHSVELTPQQLQAGADQPSDTTQAGSNNLAEAVKGVKPEEISLPQATFTSKGEDDSKTQVEDDHNGSSGQSVSASVEEQSNSENKVGTAGSVSENEIAKGALNKTNTQAEEVKGLGQQSSAALAETHSQVAQLTNTPVRFAASQQNPNRTGAIAEFDQRQTVATAHARELVAYGGTRLQDLLSLGQSALDDIQPVATTAQAAIDQSLAQNRAAIMTQINGMCAQVSSQAKSAQAQIAQKHQTTIPAIQAATTAARQRIEAAHTAALAALTTSENGQNERIHQLYGQGEKDFRAAGSKVGNEALGIGRQRQVGYLSQRNGESDPLDGSLHDNRLEAKADAAIKVAEAYKTKLIETANEQADKSREGKPKDLDTVRQVVSKSRATLQAQYQNALDGLTQAETQAIAQATETKNHLLQNVNQSLNATLTALAQQQVTQLQQLDDYGQQQKMAIARDAEHASASLQQGLTGAANTLQGMLQAFIASAQETEAPDETTLMPVVEQIRNQFDGAVTQAESQYQQSTTLSIQGVNNSGQQASQTLNQITQSSLDEISTGVAAFTDSIGQITQSANTTFAQMQSTHTRTATSSADTAVKGFQDITAGITTLFSTLNQRLEDGFKQSATGLEGSLRQVLSGKLENDITTKADEAAAQVQPRWKTVLKVLLVIVVIVVVALVIGPAVIGAVGAFAGAMGASAAAASFIGATVGGAIVGAAAGATIQMGNNLIDGKNLLHDVGKAALIGAIGGALGGFGGALGQFLANTGRLGAAGLGQTVLKFGLERAFDVAGAIGGNLAVGDPITLEGILTGVAIAGAVSIAAGSLNSLGKFGGKIQAIQEGSFNAGADFGGAAGAKVSGALGIEPNVSGGSQSNAGSAGNTAKDDGTTLGGGQTETDGVSSGTAKDAEAATSTSGTNAEVEPAQGGKAQVGEPPKSEVVAEEPTPDGRKVKVTKEGDVIRCVGECEIIKNPEVDNASTPEEKAKAALIDPSTEQPIGEAPNSGQTEAEGTAGGTTKDDGTTSAGQKRSGKETGEAGKPWEEAVRQKTGGKSEIIDGREIDSVTDDALIQAKDVKTDKPKNFLNKKTRAQIKETVRIANEQGKRAEFHFREEPHPEVREYIEGKGGIVKGGEE